MKWLNLELSKLRAPEYIGSEGYVAIEAGRKFIGIELKMSYFAQAVKNLEIAEAKIHQNQDLFQIEAKNPLTAPADRLE